MNESEFRSLLRFLSYDPTEFEPEVELLEGFSDICRTERVTFPAVYGKEQNEQMIVYLFLPEGVQPPYKTIVRFPGQNAMQESSLRDHNMSFSISLFAGRGRALVQPIYKGMFERGVGEDLFTLIERRPNFLRDLFIMMAKDLRQTVDYLGTREDLDIQKLAYVGFSLGGEAAPFFMAVEPRIKQGILVSGGLPGLSASPDEDPANYAPYVTAPFLMLNGKEDTIFPYETSQKPMLDLMKTSEEHKQHITYPGGHGILHSLFQKQIRKDILDWLDRYQGPVQ
jgi:dienelactone hydrolase